MSVSAVAAAAARADADAPFDSRSSGRLFGFVFVRDFGAAARAVSSFAGETSPPLNMNIFCISSIVIGSSGRRFLLGGGIDDGGGCTDLFCVPGTTAISSTTTATSSSSSSLSSSFLSIAAAAARSMRLSHAARSVSTVMLSAGVEAFRSTTTLPRDDDAFIARRRRC